MNKPPHSAADLHIASILYADGILEESLPGEPSAISKPITARPILISYFYFCILYDKVSVRGQYQYQIR